MVLWEKLLTMTKVPKIKDKQLLEEALTHRSFLNETSEKIPSNERLEFLGDSILSFVVSDYLFSKYPDFNEGKLTNLRSLLVNTKMLAILAKECDLGSKLRLSKGEEESGGRNNQSLLADTFEAYLGALFMDQGLEVVKKFIYDIVIPEADKFIKNNMLKDPKSRLQELVQSKKQGQLQYRVLAEEGPAHARQFTVGVFVNDEILGQGNGRSKQLAEEEAAKKALSKVSILRQTSFLVKLTTMSVVIRLARTGKRGERKFRIVVKEKRSKRDGDSIETLGSFEKGTKWCQKSKKRKV